jgi:beta-N-acetylhexosaminidase
MRLREHFAGLVQPPIEVVGCDEHRRLAREIADASVTLVRDPGRVLPLGPGAGDRVAVIVPEPVDLTPAETSSYLRVGLAAALRQRGFAADDFAMPLDPTPADVAGLVSATAHHAITIVCTFDAVSFPGQVLLVSGLAGPGIAGKAGEASGRRLVAVALRSPYDASVFPAGTAAVCTYGIQPPQIDALADALLGLIPFSGHLPVNLESAS